jgi:glutamate/tyrosine decarboxylase-like PLP-dependent enzyme
LNTDNLSKLFEIISKYLEETPRNNVVNYKRAKELEAEYDFSLPQQGLSEEGVFEKIRDYLDHSLNTINPQFNNQLYAGVSEAAFMAEVITALTNTSMATYEVAPFATLIERELTRKLNSIVGFNGDEGIMVTGGSNANMLALHCARHRFNNDTRIKGNTSDLVAFVSDQAHYSFEKAYNLMGLGLDNLIKVESDEDGKMKPASLESLIVRSINDGKKPFFIASTAGTTVKGAFDPIEKIDLIAKKYDLWHHVDGAWGAPVLLTDKYKSLMEGCEKADSLTWDAHKLMSTGLITTFFLTKHNGILQEANSGGGSRYIFHEYENADYDYGPRSLQCGRKVDSFKLWLHWQKLGDKGVGLEVEKLFDKAKYFEEKILADTTNFKLISPRQSLNVCFQVIPEDSSRDINEYNYHLRYKIVREGKFLTNFSRLEDGTIFFRHVFVNSRTSFEDIDKFLDRLVVK